MRAPEARNTTVMTSTRGSHTRTVRDMKSLLRGCIIHHHADFPRRAAVVADRAGGVYRRRVVRRDRPRAKLTRSGPADALHAGAEQNFRPTARPGWRCRPQRVEHRARGRHGMVDSLGEGSGAAAIADSFRAGQTGDARRLSARV